MIEKTFEITYNDSDGYFHFVTKDKIDAIYLMHKLMKHKGIDNNLLEFKEDDETKEFTRDDVIEMIYLINSNAITRGKSFVNIDTLINELIDPEF